MQIFLYQKNKNQESIHKIKNHSEKGFTLIECILAVGILSIVVASIVGLQSSIISVTQIATDSMRASWAVRSTMAQMQYLLESQGQDKLPESNTFPWVTDKDFQIKINRAELKDVKVSQFLTSAMGVYNLVNPNGNENLDTEKMFASVNSMLDKPSGSNPKGNFSNFTIEVNWNSGTTSKNILEGFFFVDNDIFKNIKLPDIGGNSGNNENQPPNTNQGNGTGRNATGTGGNANGTGGLK